MTRRRDFLTWLGGSSLLAAVPLHGVAAQPATRSDLPISDAFDMSWVDRIQGKRVGVFDSPGLAEGAGLFRASAWRKQYADVYGTSLSDLAPVLVIRHEAIPLVMNDAFWDRYQIGKEVKMKDPATSKWARINPIAAPAPGAPAQNSAVTLKSFIETGGVVLACRLAFGGCIGRIQEEEKVSHAEAEKRAISMLVPGVILQPSGFFAVLKAQESGGGYILAS